MSDKIDRKRFEEVAAMDLSALDGKNTRRTRGRIINAPSDARDLPGWKEVVEDGVISFGGFSKIDGKICFYDQDGVSHEINESYAEQLYEFFLHLTQEAYGKQPG